MKIFDKLNAHIEKKMPFALYAKPNSTNIIGLFQNDFNDYFATTSKDKGFVMNCFGDDKLWIIPESKSDVIIEKFDFHDNNFHRKINPDGSKFELSDNELYKTLVNKGIRAIKNNDFEKLVLARTENIHFEPFSTIATFKNIVKTFPDSFRYLYYHPKFNFWCGAFSEKLMQIDGVNFKTMALAGTQKNTDIQNIVWQQKEITEQQLVTDYITTALENQLSEMIVSKPFTIQHGQLCHIKTDISGKLKNDSDVFSLLKTLNPTPAVCGIPKDKAKEFIVKNEKVAREFYSGVVGEINKDFETSEDFKSQLFVNLRCMKIKENQATLFVGAGITKESEPDKEWEETCNKTLAMKNCLAN